MATSMSAGPMTHTQLVLRSPRQVLESLPYLFGYHLHSCLVLISVEDGVLGSMQRLDLPTYADRTLVPIDYLAALRACLEASLSREVSSQLMVVAYSDGTRNTRRVLSVVRSVARDLDLELTDIIVVKGDRFTCDHRWHTDGQRWAPHSSTESGLLAAEFVAMGRAPLPSREAVEQLFASAALPGTHGALEDFLAGPRDVLPSSVLRTWAWILSPHDEPSLGESGAPTTEDLVLAGGAVLTARLRDVVVQWIAPGIYPDHLVVAADVRAFVDVVGESRRDVDQDGLARQGERLALACRVLEPQFQPYLLSVVAVFNWFHGEGTKARVALERSRQLGGSALTTLLIKMLDNGFRIQDLAAARAG